MACPGSRSAVTGMRGSSKSESESEGSEGGSRVASSLELLLPDGPSLRLQAKERRLHLIFCISSGHPIHPYLLGRHAAQLDCFRMRGRNQAEHQYAHPLRSAHPCVLVYVHTNALAIWLVCGQKSAVRLPLVSRELRARMQFKQFQGLN